MAVTRTSREAYYKVKLGKNQQIVLDTLGDLGIASNQDIADKLGWSINRVTGRMKELRDDGYVAVHGVKRNKFGNNVKTWCVHNPNDDPVDLYDDTLDAEKWTAVQQQDKAIGWLYD